MFEGARFRLLGKKSLETILDKVFASSNFALLLINFLFLMNAWTRDSNSIHFFPKFLGNW